MINTAGYRQFLNIGLTGLLVLAAGVALAVEFEAVADATVRGDLDDRRNDNYGCSHVLTVGGSRGGSGIPYGDPDAIRSLLRFELSGFSGPVSSADLELIISGFVNDAPPQVHEISVHRLLAGWEEGNGSECGVHPPECTDPNSAHGVAWDGVDDNNQTQPDFDPTPVATVMIDEALHSSGQLVLFDVTTLVQDWVSGTPNHGLVLRDVASDGTFRHLSFGSRENDAGDYSCGVWPYVTPGPRLRIYQAVASEAKTWSDIKGLYR